VKVQGILKLSRDWNIFLVFRRGLDGLTREFGIDLRIRPTHFVNPGRRNQHLLAGPPIAGCDFDVADSPCLIIDMELIYVANLTITSFNVKSYRRFGTPQTGIGRLAANPIR
jgi:hypothetical protein